MKDLFIKDLLSLPPSFTLSKWMLERIPFIFKNDLELYIDWKESLSKLINVDSKSIIFTGSSSIGYSLNPEKDFKAFDHNSDIDVAIISDIHFDIAWHYLRNIGTKRHSLTSKEKFSIETHRTKYIYWGTIATDKIVQILPFGEQWVKAMEEMTKKNPTKGREINFRIYKDFEALRAYQLQSLNKAKDLLIVK